MCAVFTDNLHDHLAAAAANLQDEANFLEQAVYVNELTEASAEALRLTARQAWREAPADQRTQRVRFGVYFFSTPDRGAPSAPESAPLRNLPAPARAARSPSRRTSS